MKNDLPFRAVISDMDGTLLLKGGFFGKFTIETLNKLAEQGVDLVLATGRHYANVKAIFEQVDANRSAMITSNGACIHDHDGNLLYHNFLPEDLAFELMNLNYDPENIVVSTYQEDNWYMGRELKDSSGKINLNCEVVDFAKHNPKHTQKVFFLTDKPETLVGLEKLLNEKYGDKTEIVYSQWNSIEVMNKGVSKGAALDFLVSHQDYSLKNCIAFGDNMNDETMLIKAGKGCIMANANPRLFKKLPELEIIGHHNTEAVASYIRALFGIS